MASQFHNLAVELADLRMANAAAAQENLFLLNSTQILDDRPDSFFYDLLRIARHVQQ